MLSLLFFASMAMADVQTTSLYANYSEPVCEGTLGDNPDDPCSNRPGSTIDDDPSYDEFNDGEDRGSGFEESYEDFGDLY